MHLFETLLYRGDSTAPSNLRGDHKSIGQLFGNGIYLTDQPTIADQYALSRIYHHDDSGAGIFRSSRDTKEEAIRDYIGYIIDVVLEQSRKLEELGNRYREMIQHGDDRDQVTERYRETTKKLKQSLVRRAKEILKREIPNLRLVHDPHGWQIVRNNFRGTVTTFDVPNDYLKRTLDGDKPLPNRVLKAIQETIHTRMGDVAAFRDQHNDPIAFSTWISRYRDEGVIYAWQHRITGGRGLNPSWDDIFNGTHGGQSISNNDPKLLTDLLKSLDYVGITFLGGNSQNGYNRGGGSRKHRSYVFHDDMINQFKIDTRDDGLENNEIVIPRSVKYWGKRDA